MFLHRMCFATSINRCMLVFETIVPVTMLIVGCIAFTKSGVAATVGAHLVFLAAGSVN